MEGRINSLEVQMGTVFARLKPLEDEIPENRRFRDTMNAFKTDLLARQDAERIHHDDQHKQNSRKLTIIAIFIAICTMIVSAIGVVVVYNQSHHAKTVPLITHHQPAPQTDAESTLPPTFQVK